MEKKILLILSIILLSSIAFRFWELGKAHSLQQDEAVSAYDAYSIMLTGRDAWGNFIPVLFREYGAFNNQIQVYLTVPFVAVFGLNEFSARAAWALLGGLLIPLAAFIAGREIGGNNAGLAAAALAAVSPWMIFTSRFALASNLAHAFTAMGFASAIAALRNGKWWVPAGIFFALAANTYGGVIAAIAFFALFAALLFHKQLWKDKKNLALGIAAFAILITPLALTHATHPETNGYFNLLTAFNPYAWYNDGNQPFPQSWFTNIGKYLNANVLIDFDGKIDYYHLMPQGFLPAYLPAVLLVGVAACIIAAPKEKRALLLFAWIAAAVLGAALFFPAPNIRRLNSASPAFEIVAGIGITMLIKAAASKKKFAKIFALAFLAAIALWIGVSTLSFASYLYETVPMDSNPTWYYGYGWKEAVAFAETHREFDEVCASSNLVSSQPYIYALFYSRYPPVEFQKQDYGKIIGDGTTVTAVGKRYEFGEVSQCDDAKNPLYVVEINEAPLLQTMLLLSDENGYASLRLARR